MAGKHCRSWLYVPGDRPDRHRKAVASAADGVIFDLEDAVGQENKVRSRAHVLSFLAKRPRPEKPLAVRINPIDSLTGMDDLVALARSGSQPDLIVVPKVDGGDPLRLLDRLLRNAGHSTQLCALVESPRGICSLPDIVDSCDRLTTLMFGAADYCADLGQQVDHFRLGYAQDAMVNAGAMRGLAVVDSPHFGISETEGFMAKCKAAADAGFSGKAAIHPSQLDVINAAFAPSTEARARARRILDGAISGAQTIDGKMVDAAMIKWARRIQATEIGEDGSARRK